MTELEEAELTEENVGVRPGNILVPVSSHYALYALENALQRAKCGQDVEARVIVNVVGYQVDPLADWKSGAAPIV